MQFFGIFFFFGAGGRDGYSCGCLLIDLDRKMKGESRVVQVNTCVKQAEVKSPENALWHVVISTGPGCSKPD